jgi:hypothetical protein
MPLVNDRMGVDSFWYFSHVTLRAKLATLRRVLLLASAETE